VAGVKALALEMKVKTGEFGKRSDVGIAQSAKNIIGRTRSLPAADAQKIPVAVKGGAVTLAGTVHSWDERDLATRSAGASAGLRNVVHKMSLVC